MSRGGARKGAGRKKSLIQKKICSFRLTDEEQIFLKESLAVYRQGNENNTVRPSSQNESIVKQSRKGRGDKGQLEAGLLAHLEDLYRQEYGWLEEYRDYLKDESYDKYTLDEITLHQEIVHLQIVALIPHLQNLKFSPEVKQACSPMDVGFIHPIDRSEIRNINDFYVPTWKRKVPQDGLDYGAVDNSLARTFKSLKFLQLEVRELEKKLHQYDW